MVSICTIIQFEFYNRPAVQPDQDGSSNDGEAPTDPDDPSCIYMVDGTQKWGDARGARDIVTKLNQKISDTVGIVRGESPGNTRLNYVPIDGANSAFAGHEVCGTSTSWFLNVDQVVNSPDYVFHPNTSGQQGYASMVAAEINAS